MATHKSALKRHRQSLKRRANNRQAKAAIRTAIKGALQAAKTGDTETAESQAKKATSLLDKAVVHGVHHKKNAARRISRLHQAINAAK